MPKSLPYRETLSGSTLRSATGEGMRADRSALTSVTIGPRAHEVGPDTLVVIFLRGGADGLNIVVPYGDDDYYRLRPTLAIPKAKHSQRSAKECVLPLDDFFGLHPALSPLWPAWQEGQLAFVHAIGSGDHTRSHFQAMAAMERGLAEDAGGAASGWLARHLLTTETKEVAPLRAVAVSDTLPESLRGAPGATVLQSLSDFSLSVAYSLPTGSHNRVFHRELQAKRLSALQDTLHRMYDMAGAQSSEERTLMQAGTASLKAMEAIHALDPEHYRPEHGAIYPKDDIGHGLEQVACLIKGRIGLEVACLDMTGWDTHVEQGGAVGWQASRLSALAKALAAFLCDLGPLTNGVTVVVMTEFGRRAYENAAGGTDHGRAGVMMVMGGGIRGGKVYAKWPGLQSERLEGPGDLRVTTDYRDALADILLHRLRNAHLDSVFPNFEPHLLGLSVPKAI
jgi:uncharacterized protein (DUF1501 family)